MVSPETEPLLELRQIVFNYRRQVQVQNTLETNHKSKLDKKKSHMHIISPRRLSGTAISFIQLNNTSSVITSVGENPVNSLHCHDAPQLCIVNNCIYISVADNKQLNALSFFIV